MRPQRKRKGGATTIAALMLLVLVALIAAAPVAAVGTDSMPGASRAAKEYAGTTDQHCPVFGVEDGECRAGEKLPFSFEVKGNTITDLQAVIIEHCEGSEPPRLTTMEIPGPVHLRGKPGHQSFVAGGNIHTALRRTGAFGNVKAHVANGYVASLEGVGEDTYCYGRDIKWRATPR
jgi:hypothetical protein